MLYFGNLGPAVCHVVIDDMIQAVNIVEKYVIDLVDARVDVPGQTQIDDEEKSIASHSHYLAEIGRAQQVGIGLDRADDNVNLGQNRPNVFKINHDTVKFSRHPLSTSARPVGDEQTTKLASGEVFCSELSRLTSTDQERSSLRKILKNLCR